MMTATYAISDPPLDSRLRPQTLRPGTVQRTALLNRLRVARRPPVVVVTAPAGYGKTTLLADWARRDERAFAWLTVDATDDDPRSLLGSLAASLERVHACDDAIADALTARRFDAHAVLARISRCLDEHDEPIVLVLDDLHRISRTRTLDVLPKLVTALPPGAQLVLSGRTEPPLPLARLRAEGRLAEIGVAELRLAPREAATLVRAAGLELADDEVRRLEESTEGWPAGLYLAALALRAHDAGPALVRGADRFLTDYFRLEALADLPPSEVEFVLRASVLEEMSGPACDAVLERSGSARALESLERSNVFVIPLDRERRAYRFHRLFREMLEAELARSAPAAVVSLNERAADWAEEHGDVQAAVGHARAAGDRERVLRLIESFALQLVGAGEIDAVSGWLAALDDAGPVHGHPAIAYLAAFTSALLGRAEDAERWARAAEHGEHARAMPDGSPTADAWAALLRAMLGREGAERMRDDAQLAVVTLAEESRLRPSALVHAGLAHVLLGEHDEAESAFEDAAEAGRASSAAVSAALALAERSLLAATRGDWDAAEQHALAARETVTANRLDGYPTSALPYAVSARSALRHSNWVRARDDGERAASLLPGLTHAMPALALQVRLELARVRLALADETGAASLLDEVDAIRAHRPGLGVLEEEAVELRRAVDEAGAAEGWPSSLTGAELRLLPHLTTCLSFREIAERLFVSRNTIKTQAISVYRKLGVSSRSAAIARATELGLVGGLAAQTDLLGSSRSDDGLPRTAI
jgi:LuxR family transcriptional regulator, maltose regulon positive regulatory protein